MLILQLKKEPLIHLECITTQSYERLKGLKEWNFGVLEGQSEQLNPPILSGKNSYGDFFVTFGGESDIQVQQRMVKTLTKIMNRSNHECVLAISHGGACARFLQYRLESNQKKHHIGNCAILHFSYDSNKFKFLDVANIVG